MLHYYCACVCVFSVLRIESRAYAYQPSILPLSYIPSPYSSFITKILCPGMWLMPLNLPFTRATVITILSFCKCLQILDSVFHQINGTRQKLSICNQLISFCETYIKFVLATFLSFLEMDVFYILYFHYPFVYKQTSILCLCSDDCDKCKGKDRKRGLSSRTRFLFLFFDGYPKVQLLDF